MSTAVSARAPLSGRIDSLTAFFRSDRAISAGRFIRNGWWALRPVFYFSVRVAALTLLFGLPRWADFDSVRADIADSGTSHPTLLTVLDAFDGVLRAAEAVGSSAAAANIALWIATTATVAAVVATTVSIGISPLSARSPRLTRSLARGPRRLFREIVTVLIACAILASLAGKDTYLLTSTFIANTALLSLFLGATVLAEWKWLLTRAQFAPIANLAAMAGGGGHGGMAAAAGAAGTPTITADFASGNYNAVVEAMGGQIIPVVRDGRPLDPLAETDTPATQDDVSSTDPEKDR